MKWGRGKIAKALCAGCGWQLAFVFLSTTSVGAVTSQSEAISDKASASQNTTTSPKTGLATFQKASLKLSSSQYISAGTKYYRPGAVHNISSVRADMRLSHTNHKSHFYAHLADEYSASEEANYFMPFEFYYSYQHSPWTMSVGRKRQLWSHSDEFWKTGLWQPRYMQDGFRPETAGTLGFFFERGSEKSSLTFFASPIFLPDFGPASRLKHGKFVSSNPWFRAPVDRVEFSKNNKIEVNYRLSEPSNEEVVNHPALGGSWTYQPTNKGQRYRWSYAYKPVNQLYLGFPTEGLWVIEEGFEIDIHVRVLYHHLSTLEGEFEFGSGWKNLWSLTYEGIERDQPPESWITKETEDAYILSSLLSYDIRGFGRTRDQIYIGAYKLWGGDVRDHGDFTGSNSYFQGRFRYQESLALGYTNSIFGWLKRPLVNRVQALYDFAQKSAALSLELNYQPANNLEFFVAAEWLGIVDSGQAEVENGFLRLFRSNDRIATGITYVF